MRVVLGGLQLLFAAALGFAIVWAFSDADPEWAQEPLAEPAPIDLGGVELLRGLDSVTGPALAAQAAARVSAPVEQDLRVAPPFPGLALPREALDFARRAEPLRLAPEQDEEGLWVVGYGRRLPDGESGRITRERADAMLEEDLEAAAQAVRGAIMQPLNPDEYGALVEFARMIGPESFPDTLVAMLLNAGERAAAADAFLIWSQARVGGALVDSPDRTARLASLRGAFLGESWDSAGEAGGPDAGAAGGKAGGAASG
jgi:GH24 family phage-related lysozyme (muramidase)